MTEVSLPQGSALKWNMNLLTTEQLLLEVELCEQVLFGVWIPKYSTGLKGMLNQLPNERGVDEETFNAAKNTWLLRLKRAQDELIERQLLL